MTGAPPPADPSRGPIGRPRFHFTPPRNWMNDPNGLVFHRGTFHLFYQYNPGANEWGNIHWGHASSPDLFRWVDHPPALLPDPEGLGIVASGCAVVDHANTSGLGSTEEPPLVALFTHFTPSGEQVQSAAYSEDAGATWSMHPANPVIENPGLPDFRDPKVFWHEATRAWVMVVASGDRVHFYRSPNLLRWTLAGEFGVGWGAPKGVWECPDLFELRCAQTGRARWALLVSLDDGAPNGGSGTQYFTGDFDGYAFRADPWTESAWLDFGPDNYASVTWSGIGDESARLAIGWMSNWHYARAFPTPAWRGAMTLPRRLTLDASGPWPRLRVVPADELARLYEGRRDLAGPVSIAGRTPLTPQLGPLGLGFDLRAEWAWSRSSDRSPAVIGFELSCAADPRARVQIGFRPRDQQLYLDRTDAFAIENATERFLRPTAPLPGERSEIDLRVVVDRGTIEVFADGGAAAMSALVLPRGDWDTLHALVDGGKAELRGASLHRIRPSMEERR